MKHIKLFEGNLEQANWNKRIRVNIGDRILMETLFSNYIKWKLGEDDFRADEVIVTNFYFNKNKDFIIIYDTASGSWWPPSQEDESFIVTDYEELLQFMDNPELVKDTNRYNL